MIRSICALAFVGIGCSAAPNRPVSQSEALGIGRAAMQRIMDRGDVPGASVAVARGGKILWSEGFGVADVANRIPATAETRFGLGSLSKCLTTALVARLVAEGRLEWDAPIEKYWPDFPQRGKGVTLRRLASHAAGFGDDFDAVHRWTTAHHARAAEVAEEISRAPLLFAPGLRWEYSTCAYTVIGAVVERVTGATFAEAMAAHVLRPLQLGSIEPNFPGPTATRRTKFYVEDAAGRVVAAPPFNPSYKLAGAGFVGTAADIARFATTLHRPEFLPAAQIDELFTAQKNSAGEPLPFGLGWAVGAAAGFGYRWIIGPDEVPRRIVHHPGGGPGISCWLVLDRDADLAVVVLANLTGASVGGKSFDEILAAFGALAPETPAAGR